MAKLGTAKPLILCGLLILAPVVVTPWFLMAKCLYLFSRTANYTRSSHSQRSKLICRCTKGFKLYKIQFCSSRHSQQFHYCYCHDAFGERDVKNRKLKGKMGEDVDEAHGKLQARRDPVKID